MTSFFNFFRLLFKARLLEKILRGFTYGKEPNSLTSKLVPNPYQYSTETYRSFEREGIALEVDISDYIGHYLYFGFRDTSQEALFSLCKDDFYVLDIGSNIGYSLLRLASMASKGKLLGFEPDPINFSLCKKNLALNESLNNIQVRNIGLGEFEMEAGIEVRTPGNRGANRIATSGYSSAKISMSTVDKIFPSMSWPTVNLIKIDVEGYELRVLLGAEATLKKFYPILFIEINDANLCYQGDSARDLIQFLFRIGYTRITNATTEQLISIDEDITNQHLDIIATRQLSHE